jgi:hypothetical protein
MSIKLVSRAYNLNERLVKIVNPEIDIYEGRKEVVPEEFTFKYRGYYIQLSKAVLGWELDDNPSEKVKKRYRKTRREDKTY